MFESDTRNYSVAFFNNSVCYQTYLGKRVDGAHSIASYIVRVYDKLSCNQQSLADISTPSLNPYYKAENFP